MDKRQCAFSTLHLLSLSMILSSGALAESKHGGCFVSVDRVTRRVVACSPLNQSSEGNISFCVDFPPCPSHPIPSCPQKGNSHPFRPLSEMAPYSISRRPACNHYSLSRRVPVPARPPNLTPLYWGSVNCSAIVTCGLRLGVW